MGGFFETEIPRVPAPEAWPYGRIALLPDCLMADGLPSADGEPQVVFVTDPEHAARHIQELDDL
jgi:hypothetical protein